jgi:hypothetical protein
LISLQGVGVWQPFDGDEVQERWLAILNSDEVRETKHEVSPALEFAALGRCITMIEMAISDAKLE